MSAVDDVFEAIRAGDAERLRTLVAANAARASLVGDAGISALMFALYHRRRDLVDILLAADPELNVFDAAALGDAPFVTEMLDRHPGFLRARAADGFTLLHLGAFFGRREVVELLLARGADGSAVSDNPMRVTPLHSASAAGQTAVVEALLRSGADPDAQQEGGWTALHQAALAGNAAMARLLLEFDADREIRSDDGRTAAALAAAKGHGEVAALLQSPAPGE
jgi:ankyrin repeat protein